MTKFLRLRAKTYNYLIDDGSEDKKAKGTKSVIKRKRKFENYKKTAQFEHKLSERHNVFTDEINKIALNSNDDKRKQPIDLIEIYAYRTSKYLVNDKE